MGRSRDESSSRSRAEGKELTRRAIVRAALKLLARNSFDSISLREVTREAGISPTAFYRHFDDMEELGLVLVEESFASLRTMIRDARADPQLYEHAIRRSAEVVVIHVRDHTDHMRFIARERHGGIRRLRQAIHRELKLFSDELAVDLAVFPFVERWPTDDRRMLADLITETMVATAAELIDAGPADEQAIVDRAVRQLTLISLGSSIWDPDRPS